MKTSVVVLLILLAGGCAKKHAEPDPNPAETVMKPDEGVSDLVSEEVTFDAAGTTIHGTITRPRADGKFPAIAIAAGSGPTDRDWRNPLIPGPNGSAKLLAEALAAENVVLLRYDKRATGKTGMPAAGVKWGDYVGELSAALSVLAAAPYVDVERIYVAGHSEGGAHALRTAQHPPVPLAGVILLSTAGRSLRDIVVWQISAQLEVSGLKPPAVKAEIESLTRAIYQIALGATVDPQTVGQLPGVQQFIMALQNPQSVNFARGLLNYDPLSAFAGFDLPVLILSGARDIQVDPELDAKPLAEASKAAGRPTRLVIVPEADHVLKRETTPRDQLTPAVGLRYNAVDRQLDPAVPTKIAEFVHSH